MTTPDRMAQFQRHNGRFAGGRAIHTVAPQPWIGNLQVPGPACHTGSASFDPDVFQPADGAVTCLRCLRTHGTTPADPTHDPNQIALALPIDPDDCDTDDDGCAGGCKDPYCDECPWTWNGVVTLQPLPAYL